LKTLGIIGGIAPESTIEYYLSIVAGYRQHAGGQNPSIIINSIDLAKMIRFVSANRLEELSEYLLVELQKLARAGADLGLLASNTPHIVFDKLQERSPMPLISIVEAACDAAAAARFTRVGLFGTRFTMQAGFYPSVFNRRGISLVVPEPARADAS
jgi:aspartate racemase